MHRGWLLLQHSYTEVDLGIRGRAIGCWRECCSPTSHLIRRRRTPRRSRDRWRIGTPEAGRHFAASPELLQSSAPPAEPGALEEPCWCRDGRDLNRRPLAPKARSDRIMTCGWRERCRSKSFGVVRGCPLGTAQDRCEWHASGTAADPGIWLRRYFYLDRRVRPVLGGHRLMGKSPKGSRQSG
jgi:hypothetical protein